MGQTKGKQAAEKRSDEVLLGVWIDPDLRTKGQAAVKILGYGDMTKFIEQKLDEAIKQAGIEPSKP